MQDLVTAEDQFNMALITALKQETKASADEDHTTLTIAVNNAYHEIAKCRRQLGNFNQAIKDFSTVISRCPKNAHAYFGRGLCYRYVVYIWSSIFMRKLFSYVVFRALKLYGEASADMETAKLLQPDNLKLVVNYKDLQEDIILCRPGEEPTFF